MKNPYLQETTEIIRGRLGTWGKRGSAMTGQEATHWMPLPEVPEEVE